MNEQQLKRAAYHLCLMRNQAPEETVMHGADPSPDGSICDVCLYSPRWRLVQAEILKHLQINTAIELARVETNYSYNFPK